MPGIGPVRRYRKIEVPVIPCSTGVRLMNRQSTVFWIVILLAAFAAVEPAFAWGPATHIGLGGTVLQNIGLLPAAIAALLSRNAVAYLYGNIAADIVFAKRLSRIKQFCHHWPTAFGVLRSAPTERSQAFAYGYLSHLAADTVAHGKFVPRLIQFSGVAINTGHLYWELRADAAQDAQTWNRLRATLGADHDEQHNVLSQHMSNALLSYGTNRFLFNRLNALTLNRGFRRSVSFMDRWSRWTLPSSLMTGYQTESVDRIISVLSDTDRSPVVREDPNGTLALRGLRDQRRDRRRTGRISGSRLHGGPDTPLASPLALTSKLQELAADDVDSPSDSIELNSIENPD